MSSIRKKYRKMRIKFDEKMRQSNVWYMEEQAATETARRLAQQNESGITSGPPFSVPS